MKFSILNRVAFRSILAHKKLYFPYWIAVTLLFSLEYILLSLRQNEYVLEFHPDLRTILAIGVFFATLLIVIITLYTSHFIQKNQRKEFGLYSVLGLEKKHIRFVMIIQNLFNWFVTSIFSVTFGFLLGSLIFIALNRLMQDTGATLMDYPFQIDTSMNVVGLLFVTFLIVIVMNAIRIARFNPIELLKSAHEGDREPKGRIWMTLLGLVALALGYYIALTQNNVLGSLSNVFLAIFLVIIGTYFLFISLSILVLKMMRNNKRFYYKPNNFLSISGMLHRMNNNAVSLASIAILCSGVILVLGITATTYRTLETQIESVQPADYAFGPIVSDVGEIEENEQFLLNVVNELSQYGELNDVRIQTSLSVFGYLSDQDLQPIPPKGSDEEKALNSSGQPIYIIGETVETYNELTDASIHLDEDEVLITSNLLKLDDFSSLNINGKTYKTKVVSSNLIPSNIAVEAIYIAFSDQAKLDALQREFPSYDNFTNEYYTSQYGTVVHFNVDGDEASVNKRLKEIANDEGLNIFKAEETRKTMYELYGGLLFIGIVVSTVLIIGTILMLYFRQISEGYQDRENYKIMKQVGLPNSLIKKTIRSQIIWIFLLPIIVAVVHNLFASKMMYMLIGLFGTRDLSIFVTSYFGVLFAFSLIYLLYPLLVKGPYYP